MGAFSGLVGFFNKPLADLAKELHYNTANILILENKEIELKKDFPIVYKNILSCQHHADKRTPIEYAKDLVASWIFEDVILKKLREKKLIIHLEGADRNREILSNQNTTTDSDYIVEYNGRKVLFELMTDYTGFWHKNHVLDLRDFKYNKLIKTSSLMICISTINNEFFIIDFRKPSKFIFIPNHQPYGGKSAYRVDLSNEQVNEFSIENLANSIIEII